MSAPRRGRWLILVGVAALLAIVIPYRFWLSTLGGYLVRSETTAPADLIVVLAGDFKGNRILTAANLVREGVAPKALVSGPGDMYGLHESDLEIPFAVRRGYPESYFVALPNDSRSTASEADVMIPELRKRRAHRIDIVTSNYHSRRALSIYRSKAPDLEFHVVIAPDRYFSSDGWWKNRDGRKIFLDEWMKTVATWFGM